MANVKDFFSEADKGIVINAIQEAEKNTSGEIRLHLENKCPRDPVHRAKQVFQDLKMHETKDRNGVLVYIAVQDQHVAIWGDEGISDKVGIGFWEDEIKIITHHFKHGKYAEGVAKAVKEIGENLKKYFPYHSNDKNELTDEISMN